MVQQPEQPVSAGNTGPGNEAPTGAFYGPWYDISRECLTDVLCMHLDPLPYSRARLRFQGFDPATNTWTLSVLVVAKAEHSEPSVQVGQQRASGVKLDTHDDWVFWCVGGAVDARVLSFFCALINYGHECKTFGAKVNTQSTHTSVVYIVHYRTSHTVRHTQAF